MTKTESAHLTAQTMLLESAEQVLQLHGAAGMRLAIPNTNNLIMVGPADWIANNVPGVEAMRLIVPKWEDAELAMDHGLETPLDDFVYHNEPAHDCGEAQFREGLQAILNYATAPMGREAQADLAEVKRERDRFERMFVAACADLGLVSEALGLDPDDGGADPIVGAIEELKALAATTQASTAQAEPGGTSEQQARYAIDGAIQYGREDRNPPPSTDHWLYEYWNIGQQLRELGKTGWDNVTPLATSSTDAQAAAEVRDAVLEEAAKLCEAQNDTDWPTPLGCAKVIRSHKRAREQADGWISVDERLPEEETDVLVRGRRDDSVCHEVAGLFHGEWQGQNSERELRFIVEHWQLLPAAPVFKRAGDTGEQADGGATNE